LDQGRDGCAYRSLSAAGVDAHRAAEGPDGQARRMNETRAVAVPSTTRSRVAMHWANRHKHWLTAALALLVLPHVPGLSSDFGRSLLSQMGIAAVFALSFNVLLGQTGLLSFGHAVYFGLGGYAAIHLMRVINHGLPLPVPLVPLAGAAAGLACG